MKKIDIYNHVLPPAYFELVKQHSTHAGLVKRLSTLRVLWDMETRASMLVQKFPDVVQVLTLSAPAGGVSIGMGLGPAHAIAITCSDQGFPHGVLSGIGLVATLDATAQRTPGRVAALAEAWGLPHGASLAQAVATLMRELGLPATLADLGYAPKDLQAMASAAQRSHFNLSAPFKPDAAHYAGFLADSLRLEALR